MPRRTLMTVTAGLALVGGLVGARLLGATAGTVDAATLTQHVQAGDIIFHPSASSQSEALRQATGSDYTHVGVLFEHEGTLQVLEAVEPVRWTDMQSWIERSADGRIVVARPDTALTNDQVAQVQAAAESHLGKPYDLLFEWGDESIYCSELIYKAYEEALGWEIGALETFEDLDLRADAVQALISARTNGDIDTSEPVVTPVSVLIDEDLHIVFSNDPEIQTAAR